jgi:hypothetical protein
LKAFRENVDLFSLSAPRLEKYHKRVEQVWASRAEGVSTEAMFRLRPNKPANNMLETFNCK